MAGERDKLSALERLNQEYEKQRQNLKGISNQQERSRIATEQIANYQKMINELIKDQGETGKNNNVQIDKLLTAQRELISEERNINTQLENQVKKRQRNVDLAKQLGQQIKNGWNYLQEQDKIIKSTNLSLGLSSTKAVAMRNAFEQSAGYVTRLGGTIGDIQNIMQGYADETGRARVMSAQMVEDITNIGKGTGLGIEQATKLGAQFELMGFDARRTMDYVQSVVDTTERMGVNTTKVLKVVNDNFKRLNTYTFQQGTKGFAQMAAYAEKFKIDINQALNAADVSRNLEGAIDLAAQLQVMGGEFAKTDPFQMLFLSRNDPAKFTEKIADMTKGLVSFRKMADGSFEKFISPADRDRIASVAKSMGMEASALTEIAQRQAEIQKMRQQMGGMGFTDEQKKVIEGAAIFNKETGKFQVSLAGTMHNIRELTAEQASKFETQQVLLEERAKQALTFDETFKATINSLKTTLLPLLNGVNQVLSTTTEWLKPKIDWLKKGDMAWAKVAGLFISAGLLWKGLLQPLAGRIGAAAVGRVGSAIRGTRGLSTAIPTGGAMAGSGSQALGAGKGAGAAAKGLGMKRLGTGAGFGAAMAGSGAGIMLAAKGISQLADSMSKLTSEQAETLSSIVKSLAWFMGGAALAAVGIAALGATATAAAPGLLAFGTTILMIGGGIGLATLGISKMADSFGNMFTALKDVDNLGEAAAGIAGITAALGAATITLPSAVGLSMTIGRIGKHANNLVKVGNAFGNIQAVMSGSKDDFIAIEKAVNSISNMNAKGGGMLADLANLLKKPLQVEFKDKNLAVVSNITMEIDGQKVFNRTYNPTGAVQKYENAKNNKGDRV